MGVALKSSDCLLGLMVFLVGVGGPLIGEVLELCLSVRYGLMALRPNHGAVLQSVFWPLAKLSTRGLRNTRQGAKTTVALNWGGSLPALLFRTLGLLLLYNWDYFFFRSLALELKNSSSSAPQPGATCVYALGVVPIGLPLRGLPIGRPAL